MLGFIPINFFVGLSYLTGFAFGHYLFPYTIYNGVTSAEWEYVEMTDNHYSRGPVTDVTDPNMRCYNSQLLQNATGILSVTAGSTLGIALDGPIIHPGVLNVYMAKAPGSETAAQFDGSGNVWFRVFQITAVTDGGTTITWPTDNITSFTFQIPAQTPSGQYLIRTEHIALHVASTYGGAQWYIGCAQVQITNGGSGTPSPLVALPGYYTGYEPGILISIFWPIPANYTQPGPPLWPPVSGGGSSSSTKTTTTTKATTTTTTTVTTGKTTTTTTGKVTTTTAKTSTGGTGTCAALYGQCGGTGFTGPTCCVSGTCTYSNAYYSQCV